MQKILVIGCPGAGKSVFSRRLKEKQNLPLYYLDMMWHKPDRSTYTEEKFDRSLKEILQTDRWIIDGNYLRTLEMRLQAADTVFFLDYPVEICLDGARERIGKRREDMPWIETEFDEAFRQWILDFPRDQRPVICRLLKQYGERREIFVFQSREDAKRYLER